MRTRPIFHSSDAAIRGHVFCSFLALVMQKYLEDLSCQAGVVPEWKSLLRDLDRLQQVRIAIAAMTGWSHQRRQADGRSIPPRPHRDAAARQQMAPPKVDPHEIRPETSRPPQAWCHVIANFAKSRLISMPCKTRAFK